MRDEYAWGWRAYHVDANGFPCTADGVRITTVRKCEVQSCVHDVWDPVWLTLATGRRLPAWLCEVHAARRQALGAGGSSSGEAQETLSVRPFEIEDLLTVLSWVDSPITHFHWLGPGIDYPIDPHTFVAHLLRGASTEQLWSYCAVRASNGQPVGYAELAHVSPDEGSGEVAHVLVDPAWRGLGVATGLVRKIVQDAFGPLRLASLYLGVQDDNAPALASYRRLGFEDTGQRGTPVEGPAGPGSRLMVMELTAARWAALHPEPPPGT